jgi:crotonobetainyl-CoA:carnitine CoA-transferase CaiB-like acyl-CoA transferase
MFLISIQSEREWALFCREFLGDAALAEDPRFATNVARVEHREETDGMIAEAFARHDAASAQAALERADVAFASVNDMAALARHPHLRTVEIDTPGGPVRMPAPGPRWAAGERRYRPVPAVGMHETLPGGTEGPSE